MPRPRHVLRSTATTLVEPDDEEHHNNNNSMPISSSSNNKKKHQNKSQTLVATETTGTTMNMRPSKNILHDPSGSSSCAYPATTTTTTTTTTTNSYSSASASCTYGLRLVRQNPTILWVPLLLFGALVAAGLTIVYSHVARQEAAYEQQAHDLAQETGDWFASQLDLALLPLFSLAQFATELDIFANLPDRIGPYNNDRNDSSLPFLPLPASSSSSSSNAATTAPTHRNVTGVCTEPLLVQRFDQIASTIKRNAGMPGVLVNLQLAPQGVVCLVHPLNNTEDFNQDPNNITIYMDNTRAIGHDTLFDPKRKVIAEATLTAEKVTIAGPLTLVQCSDNNNNNNKSSPCHPVVEKSFIARLPIVSPHHEISVNGVAYPRWGFAVAIINWMALVERSKMHDNFAARGWTFSLTRTDYIPIENNNKEGEEPQYKEQVVVPAQSPNWHDEDDSNNSTSTVRRRRRRCNQWKTVSVALETTNNEWYMTVGYQPAQQPIMAATVFFVVFVALLLASLLLVVLLQKQAHSNIQKHQAALLVQSAQDAMAAERDLNDYIAHEVRNPLSAAIAASSFVTAAVDKIILNNAVQRGEERIHLLLSVPPTQDDDENDDVHTVQAIREDMIIVDQSLHFINDLLKSMLDMHKAASSQIRLAFDKLSVRDDVFLPVQGMLYQRDETFEIQIVCPADLVIVGDRLRLQQIVMNLARNATKFVQRGFIRLRATVVVDSNTNNSHVMLYVEDSGPGIPLDKRSNLFQRFQESLDSLNQGTGVGLYLCKKLVDLMQGQIYLDESFDSGVEGFPGTRIVVNLPMTKPMKCGSSGAGSAFFSMASSADSTATTAAVRPLVQPEQANKTKKLDNPSSITLRIEDSPSGYYGETEDSPESCKEGQGTCKINGVTPAATTTVVKVVDEPALTLPAIMNVLFVDDDRTLRKLARRCLTRLVPAWNVWEASSGEMALSMIMSKDEPVAFDIIFMDQYMTTSAGQALKGTETTRQLRALGFSSPIICGLSANYDSKAPFLNCGADEFWLKPFPCALPELQRSLQDLVALRQDANASLDR